MHGPALSPLIHTITSTNKNRDRRASKQANTHSRSDTHANLTVFTVTLCDQNFHKTITFNFQFVSTNGQFLNRVSGCMNERYTSTSTRLQTLFRIIYQFQLSLCSVSFRFVWSLLYSWLFIEKEKKIKKKIKSTLNFACFDKFSVQSLCFAFNLPK